MMKYSEVPKGEMLVVIPTSFEALLTGCKLASQDRESGAISLTYTDNTKETASWAKPPELEELANIGWCSVVGTVQDQARKG